MPMRKPYWRSASVCASSSCADHRAAVAARLHQRRGLARDLAVVLLEGLVVVAVAGELEQLAQADGHHRVADGEVDARLADRGEQVGALGEVVVADDDRGVDADRLVDGGDAAPRARVVDEVVVHQGGGVDELDAHRQVEGVVAVGRAQRGAEQHQRRPQPLAAGADDVLHGVGHRTEVRPDGVLEAALELDEVGSDRGEQLVDDDAHRAAPSTSAPAHRSTTVGCGQPVAEEQLGGRR